MSNVVGKHELPEDKGIPIEIFWPNILVEKPKPIERTASGIIIPESTAMHNTPCRGIVRAVGEIDAMTGEKKPAVIKPGDLVQFNSMAGQEFQQGDVGYVMLHIKDISMRFLGK